MLIRCGRPRPPCARKTLPICSLRRGSDESLLTHGGAALPASWSSGFRGSDEQTPASNRRAVPCGCLWFLAAAV